MFTLLTTTAATSILSNMTVFQLIFGVIQSLFLLFLGVVGYYTKEFVKSVKVLTENVQNIQLHNASFDTSCNAKHSVINDNFKEIFEIVEEHENDINTLKTDVAILKSK